MVGLSATAGHLDFFDFDPPEADATAKEGEEQEQANPQGGNKCADDEESFLSLCYKTCRQLTGGEYPKRSSPFTCCKPSADGSCGLSGEKVTMKVCSGFNVAGDSEGGGCPRMPGQCLAGEEVHLSLCYKKCSDLTDGQYKNRVAAASCCSTTGFRCLFGSSSTSPSYAVGNGEGAQAAPHGPVNGGTESSQ